MRKKVAFKTLGCRLNQFETDSVLTDFRNTGYELVDFSEPADVYVVNTCTVTNQGDHKSKNAISQAVHGKEGAVVVVTGCMAESQKEYLENRGDITYVVDNRRKAGILPLVEAHFNGEMLSASVLKEDVFGFSVAEKSLHTRSMIKVQDGCDNFCTFCIVPRVRGRAVSRPSAQIIENISRVLETGFREIVLTGVNISRYADEGLTFTGLVDKILQMPGDFRIRISSMEPEGLGPDFFDLFANYRLCPHLHLCLQSGSDRILMAMRRMYTLKDYLQIIDALRIRHPLFNFTTDIMVGFPGETEQDFDATYRVAEEVGFSHVHTFKYSIRKGTRAARMPEQVPEKVKNERSLLIRGLAEENKLRYRRQFIGLEQTVLVEKVSPDGMAKGYGQHYIPVEFNTGKTGTNYFETLRPKECAKSGTDYILRA